MNSKESKFEEIKKLFEEKSNAKNAEKMSAYMKKNFDFYGIQSTARRLIYKDFLNREKEINSIDWDFLDECYEDNHRESQYLALDYLSAKQKILTFDDVPKLLEYVTSKSWWDSIDSLDRIIGNIGLRDKRIDDVMLEWSKSDNFWVRRLAIDHQLLRKENTNTELLEKIIVNNFGSDEFFINKAIGWSLRDYSKTDPDWVRNFVHKYQDKMDKVSLKEAKKYI